jgi:hypothetical protein
MKHREFSDMFNGKLGKERTTMEILSLFVVAFLGEAIWETLKMIWEDGKASIDKIGALVVGLIIAFVTGADLLALTGLPVKVPYVGIVLTGILISRGANFVHDAISVIHSAHIKAKPSAQQRVSEMQSENSIKAEDDIYASQDIHAPNDTHDFSETPSQKVGHHFNDDFRHHK